MLNSVHTGRAKYLRNDLRAVRDRNLRQPNLLAPLLRIGIMLRHQERYRASTGLGDSMHQFYLIRQTLEIFTTDARRDPFEQSTSRLFDRPGDRQ